MSKSPSRAEPLAQALARRWRRPFGLAVAAAFALPALLSAATVGDASPALIEVALEETAALTRRAQRGPTPEQLLIRNLARYFATYPLPSDAAGVAAVFEATRDSTVKWAQEAISVAGRAAEGRESITEAEIGGVLPSLLPSTLGEFDEVLFFAARPEAAVAIEAVDLAALFDTGFAWDALLTLADRELAPGSEMLPLEPAAVRRLASAVNAHSLLVLRLAGGLARAELAPHVDTEHIDRAAKVVTQRAAGQPSEGEIEIAAPTGRVFRDVAVESGIDFRHRSAQWLARFRRYGTFAPTFSGGGVTATDLDGDGWLDLLLCGGDGCRSFRNRGDGGFEDSTARTGINVPGEARMAVTADLDNDGWKDLFVTYARDSNRLFRGLPDGSFEDITAGSGVERFGDISGPAVVFDADGDGLLDLYVGNFGDYLHGQHPWASDNAVNGLPNRLYRNLGAMLFAEAPDAGAGNTGWTQAISHLDHDLDGDQDLYLANDFGRNELLVNAGDGTFLAAGSATGSDDPHHGMNVAIADVNRDGYGDIFVTNIWAFRPREERLAESNTLLLSQPDDGGVRYRRDEAAGLDHHDTGWAWAACFLDFDNDGLDDLFVANGFTDYLTFIQYRRHPEDPDQLYPINNGGEPNHLFRGTASGALEPYPQSGAEIEGVNSRSAVALDYDRDGDVDLAITTFHSQTRLLRNELDPEHKWLRIALRGNPAAGVSPGAIGAQLAVRGPDGLYAWRQLAGGEGYLTMDAEEVEMGLGTAERVEVEVTWPGGSRQRHEEVPANRHLVLFR